MSETHLSGLKAEFSSGKNIKAAHNGETLYKSQHSTDCMHSEINFQSFQGGNARHTLLRRPASETRVIRYTE
jgi:hypothetical protein